jgi:hypothetical protein
VRYFYDCEFIEDGRSIDLISVGVVSEDGREYYAICTEFDETRAGEFVRKHVLPQLPSPSDKSWRSRERIREDLWEFVGAGNAPVEMWAWMGAYDHVAVCGLWGAMPALPKAWPRFTREVRQEWERVGKPELPPRPEDAHHALADARWARQVFELSTGGRG